MKHPSRPDSFESYINLQTTVYKSFESNSINSSTGQCKYINQAFTNINKDSIILDIACGDGVGLVEFNNLGFKNVIGFEYDKEKHLHASGRTRYHVDRGDFHDLSIYKDGTFDIVYSSHSLEHAYKPEVVLQEFHRVLKKRGILKIIIPFPDSGPIDAHVAKEILGTDYDDNGIKVIQFISNIGFKLEKAIRDAVREPEIWLDFIKSSS